MIQIKTASPAKSKVDLVGKQPSCIEKLISETAEVSVFEKTADAPFPNQNVQWINPSILKVPNYYASVYGDLVFDGGLFLSIEKEGIIEPLVVTQENLIISGVKRYLVALALNLDQVPVRVIELTNPKPYHSVSFNIRTAKDNYTLFQEIRVLRKIFNPGQGYRSDLLGFSNISLNNFLGVKINVVKRLWSIHLVCSELFGEGTEEYENIVSKLKHENIHAVLNVAKKKLIEKKKVKEFIMPVFDEFRVFNKTSENPSEVMSQSVQSIIISPPYFKMRLYGNGETELGQENTPTDYVNELLKIFATWKRILKKDGAFIININESIKGLSGYPMVCEQLFSKMPEIGFELKHRLFWFKNNPIFDGCKSINNAVEFIYIFGHIGETTKFNSLNLDPNVVVYLGDKILNILRGNTNQPALIRSKLEENGYFLEHTAMMPEYLARTLVQLTTDENDLVFDGFSGLGTTGRMANELGRKYVGYEINEEYFKQSLILKGSTIQIAA